ncbi:hypothetical protein PCAR4_1240006 [Paraburkholderia caribensis]|nr:hypothetical protein PCAR4_1240006 [Paraburkholderia caribensis]
MPPTIVSGQSPAIRGPGLLIQGAKQHGACRRALCVLGPRLWRAAVSLGGSMPVVCVSDGFLGFSGVWRLVRLALVLLWHPLDVIGLLALPLCGAASAFGCLRRDGSPGLLLASALCLGASSVAPVRDGICFWLSAT